MANTAGSHTRRDAIQQILMATAGLCLFTLHGCGSAKQPTETKPAPQQLAPFFMPPMKPLQPGPGGLEIRTWVRSSQTNQQFPCVEFGVAAKKMGPEPHYHKALDELMYVLDGTATVMVEDTVYEIPAGGWHFRPRGMVHTFFNNTNQSFRGIDMYFNQNFEDYLEELFHKIIPDMRQNKLTMADHSVAKKMHELHEKFGLVGFPERLKTIVDKYDLW